MSLRFGAGGLPATGLKDDASMAKAGSMMGRNPNTSANTQVGSRCVRKRDIAEFIHIIYTLVKIKTGCLRDKERVTKATATNKIARNIEGCTGVAEF